MPLSGDSGLRPIISDYIVQEKLVPTETTTEISDAKIDTLVQSMRAELGASGGIDEGKIVDFFASRGFSLTVNDEEMASLINQLSEKAGVASTNEVSGAGIEKLMAGPSATVSEAKTEYTVKTDSPEMKKLNEYVKTSKKSKLSKLKGKTVTAPLKKKLNENIFGTRGELKGVKESSLEKFYMKGIPKKNIKGEGEEKLESLKEGKKRSEASLKSTEARKNDLVNDRNKLEKGSADWEKKNESIKFCDDQIKEMKETIGKKEADIRFYSEEKKDVRTNMIINQLKNKKSGQGGVDFKLTVPNLHDSGKTGEIQGMYFGAKNNNQQIQEFDKNEKTILIMTGSGDIAENYAAPMVEELQNQGYQTVIFNYMGLGDSVGEMSEWGLYASAEAAYQYLSSEEGLGVSEENITLTGYSLGGYAIAETAVNHPKVGQVVFDRSYTSGLDVAEKAMGKLGKKSKQFMHNVFGDLDTEAKIKKCNPEIKVAIFEDKEELESKDPNFGEEVSKGKWELKKRFQKLEKNIEHHVIEGKGHYHSPKGVWYSNNPEMAYDAREAFFKFLPTPKSRS